MYLLTKKGKREYSDYASVFVFDTKEKADNRFNEFKKELLNDYCNDMFECEEEENYFVAYNAEYSEYVELIVEEITFGKEIVIIEEN